MRRISILILTAMLLTIGGVYATWNYANGNATGQQFYLHPPMADAVVDTAKGIISINKDAAIITIDDPDNDHVADITYAPEAAILVTFTPSATAEPNVFANGISLVYSITGQPGWEYDGKQIFDAAHPGEKIGIEMTKNVAADGTITFTGKILVSELVTHLSFGEGQGFTLPTADSYSRFKEILNNGNFKITVEEGTPSPAA